MQDNYLSVYARTTFSIQDPDQLSMLVMSIDYDDSFVAYLNGIEFWRQNISGMPPAYDTPADSRHEAGSSVYFSIDPDLLLTGVNVLAIQGHNYSLSSTDFSLIPRLRRTTPYMQNITRDSLTIMWESHPPTNSWLRYRQHGSDVWTEIHQSGAIQIHQIQIDGFEPGSDYEYQISLDGSGEWRPVKPATFSTPALDNSTYRVVVYGDTRTEYEQHQIVADAILASYPDIIFHVGDLVESGKNYEDWGQQFFSPAAEMLTSIPFVPVLGNHEYAGEEHLWYLDLFELPDTASTEKWFSMNYGCTQFVGLDSNETEPDVSLEPGSDQYNWLQAELQSTAFNDATWKFVLFHHPIYTSGPHIAEDYEHLVTLFEAAGVNMVFNGHNHHYERSYKDGIYYIVTGGGGAPLADFPFPDLNPYSQIRLKTYEFVTLDVDCASGTLDYSAWNLEGQQIDGPISMTGIAKRMFLPITLKE